MASSENSSEAQRIPVITPKSCEAFTSPTVIPASRMMLSVTANVRPVLP